MSGVPPGGYGRAPSGRLLVGGLQARSLGSAMAEGPSHASETTESAAQTKDGRVAQRTCMQLEVENIEEHRVPEVPCGWSHHTHLGEPHVGPEIAGGPGPAGWQ